MVTVQEKFILLDIDGVMVPANSWKKVDIEDDGFYKFSPGSEQELDRLLMLSGVTIILTTTHRLRYDKLKWGRILKKRLPYIADIKTLNDFMEIPPENSSRLREITQWGAGPGQNKKYVILDDDKSFYNLPSPNKDRWVVIPPLIGLNKETAAQALDILMDIHP